LQNFFEYKILKYQAKLMNTFKELEIRVSVLPPVKRPYSTTVINTKDVIEVDLLDLDLRVSKDYAFS